MQQLWRIHMTIAKCVETTSESHVNFAKRSPGEMKTWPWIAQNITTTKNQTAAMNCHTYIPPFTMKWRSVSCLWRLRLLTPVGLLCSFECRSHQAQWCMFPHFAHRSHCQRCNDSVAGPDVGRSAAGIEFLVYHSNFVVHDFELKARKNCRQTFLIGNQGLTPPLHCPGSTSVTLYVYPRIQTGFQSLWWDTHALDIWQFHFQKTLKTVCYQPYWRASEWMLVCTLHRVI